LVWRKHKVLYWRFSSHPLEIQFVVAITRIKFGLFAVQFAQVFPFLFFRPLLLQNVHLTFNGLESLAVCGEDDIEFPGTWGLFVLDGGHLLETVLETLGLLGVEAVVVEEELGVGEIFAEELAEVVFGFWAVILFGEWENELVEAVFGDREEELVVFFDGDEVASFTDEFSQEASVLDSGDESVDLVLLRELGEEELFEVGDLDGLLLFNVLELLIGCLFIHDFCPLNFILGLQQLFCLAFLKSIEMTIFIDFQVQRVVRSAVLSLGDFLFDGVPVRLFLL
jgi:hypothetical protein